MKFQYLIRQGGGTGLFSAVFVEFYHSFLTGIISHGPIYAWYPALQKLRQHGMRSGLVAVFLYNRAIKILLLPVMVYYFGIQFVGILLVTMIVASVIEGHIIEKFEQ